MKTYDVIVIGFGKAGKTFAAKSAAIGKKVALIEKDEKMFGGTCINIGCIPTKTLLVAAEKGLSFEQVMQQKDVVVQRLNAKNLNMLTDVVDIYVGQGSFASDKIINVTAGDDIEQLTAEIIVINTGSVSNVLPIAGLESAKNVYDSTGIQQLVVQPKTLGIIGGGNIGVEFATLYATLGTKVTILEASPKLFGRDEPFVAEMAETYFAEQGISVYTGKSIQRVENESERVVVHTADQRFDFDVLMYATGRKANVAALGLENTSIQLSERNAIVVDDYCQTTVPGVFAVGDVNGGLQFTYVSLDDFRIIWEYVYGNQTLSLSKRNHVPSATFINPPLARVGLTEQQAIEKGLPVVTKSQLVATMPRAHVNNDLRGQFKVVVHKETKQILGATFYGKDAHELINLVTMAMDNHIPYTYFTQQIFTHPTMAENLNDLFAITV